MTYKPKYLSLNWAIKTSLFNPNMEILGSFIACINELCVSLKDPDNRNTTLTKKN